MGRVVGALVVLALIGGAVWIGLSSGTRDFVDSYPYVPPHGPLGGDDLECPPDEMRGDTEGNILLEAPGFNSQEEAVRNTLDGVLASDELQVKGIQVIIVRESYRIAVATLTQNQSDEWTVSSVDNRVSARIFDA
jgi:hypothetical protein